MRRKISEDDRRICYASSAEGLLVQHFKDPVGEESSGSGVLDSRISGYLMDCLNHVGIKTHFVRQLNMRELLVQDVKLMPISIVSHTVVSQNLATRFQSSEGAPLARPLLEFYYHAHLENSRVPPVLVGEDHIRSFSWITEDDLQDIISCALRVHDFLSGFFMATNLLLCDLHLQFGQFFDPVTESSHTLVVDGPLPDALSLKDIHTGAYISTLSLYKGNTITAEQKKILGSKMGLLDAEVSLEKKESSAWLKLFKKGLRD
ncbi:MAG: hypothetical protein LBD66_01695 [Holosporales bacterium]|jgi:phosphoribosylaminoimidazole-succinocarboxamide synthase|nr:hypothetical protein [Holosporales bacterium]